MKVKNLFTSLLAVTSIAVMLTGCGNKSSESDTNGKTTITFWAAPNPTQVKYWKNMAKNFEKENTNIIVKVSQMKESPSSEATIQSAIASKTAPTISENITRSFAAQLADSKAIIPLNKENTYQEIISERNMSKTVDSWKFSDGNQYVLPVYSNPILFAWRLDILKSIGVTEVPKTYSELLSLGTKLKKTYSDKFIWAKPALVDPTAWQRWFDFFPLYDAASNGAEFISDNKLVADKKTGTKVFALLNTLQKDKLLLTSQSTDPFENGSSVMTDLGPWTFPNWKEKYPELKFNSTYTITTPVVPDNMGKTKNIKTYADAKGVVIYSQATTAQRKAAMKFMKFIFSDVQNDVSWLNTTSLIPARDDATTNKAFDKYFKDNPEMSIYAENVPYAIPAMDNAKYNEIQQAFSEKGWVPVVKNEISPTKGWSKMTSAVKGVMK